MKKYSTLWVVLCLLLMPVATQGQSMNASISGTVLDATGAVVSGAQLSLTSVATGAVAKTTSSDQGLYSFPNLTTGAYELMVTALGFRDYMRKGITVTLDASVRADIKLQVGTEKQLIEVVANATQVNFDNGEQKHGIDPSTLNELPLIVSGGPRSAASFVTLMPGVTTGAGKDPANARINGGMYDGGDEAVLDGVSLAEGAMSQSGMISAHADFQLSPDMVSEVKVLTSNYEPQYGSSTAGQIIATTKSGSTQFHGAAYDYLRNKVLNATQYGADAKPKNNQNDFGANFGGPVKIPGLWSDRVKTFFYVNYEGFRIRGGINRPTLSIPSLQERQGDFTDWVDQDGNLIPIFDPATLRSNPGFDPNQAVGPANLPYLRDQFMGCDGNSPNVICSSDPRLQNSLALQWFKFLPNPTSPGPLHNYLVPTPVPNTLSSGQNNWLIKIDQDRGSSDHFALSIYYQYQPPQLYSQLPPQLATEDMQDPENSSVDRLNWDHTFNPNLLNHAAFGYLNRHEAYGSISAKYVNDLPKIPGVASPDVPPVIGFGDEFDWYGNARGLTSKNLTSRPSYIVNDLLTWVKGRHTLKFGGEYRAMGENNHEGQNTAGEFLFNSGETGLEGLDRSGNSIASFLLEQVDYADVDFRYINRTYPRIKAYILHAGDTWKVTSRLTLSYGLRWEMYTPSKEKYDRFSFFDPSGANAAADGRPGRLAFAGTKWGAASFGRDYPELLWKKGFGPRIGLAYALQSNTVVRSGYGIFYSQAFFPGWRGGIGVDGGITGQAGFAATPSVGSSVAGMVAAFRLSNGFPQNFTPPPFIDSGYLNGQDIFYRPIGANRLPYSQQWNLTIEHQFPKDMFLSLGYVGNKGTRLLSAVDPRNAVNPQYLSMGQALNDTFGSTDSEVDGIPAPYPGWADQLNNLGLCSPTVAQALLPYPQYCSSLQGLNENEGNSTFHSLQAKFEKRFSGGTYLLTSYTFSKLLSSTDSVQEAIGANPGAHGGISPFQKWRNKGLSYSDVPHTLAIAGVYDLPFGRGRRFLNSGGALNAIVGGWSLSSTFRFTSGMPLWFRAGNCNIPGPFQMGCFPAILPGANPWAQEKSHLNPSLPLFNVDAFEPASAFDNFYSGTGSRMTTLRGFGYKNQDVSLTKYISIGERVKVELRGEFFNVWNNHFFTNPGSWGSMGFGNDISSPDFGMWDGSVSDPRNGQVGLRISF
jgi:hypothetical protein